MMSSPPESSTTEGYETYGLSPPRIRNFCRSFVETIGAIQCDFKGKLDIEVEGNQKVGFTKVSWTVLHSDGSRSELCNELKKVLLFLYARKFMVHGIGRVDTIKQILQHPHPILRVIKADRDRCLSSDPEYENQYVRACLTIHRYFKMDGASGFPAQFPELTLYLRVQVGGSCFLQAPCVAMSYLFQGYFDQQAEAPTGRIEADPPLFH